MRHIPICETAKLDVLKFDDALLRSNLEVVAYDKSKWLYVPNFYSDYRYILGTKGQNPLICIGINPSTAEPDRLDRTLQSVERISINNGFDSFIMFNVYAQRATNPDDMEQCFNSNLHSENMKAFRYILKQSNYKPKIWAAWGSIIEKRDYLAPCVLDMVKIGKEYKSLWFTAGKRSIKGHPHHPLYLKSDSNLEVFSDVENYLESLHFKNNM